MAVDREALARALREARENYGMSQEAVAKRVGVSRTVLAQIELGNRPVSEDELSRLSSVYGQAFSDFEARSRARGASRFSDFEFAPELLEDEDVKARVLHATDLFALAFGLDVALGLRPHAPLRYEFPSPRNAAEALEQGQRAAEEERRRIGIGAMPLGHVADLISPLRMRACETVLPNSFMAVFVRHECGGAAILLNSDVSRSIKRFVIVQSYAHALFDGDMVIKAARPGDAKDLRTTRAIGFAVAFLLPQEGVRAHVQSLGKGQASRKLESVFDGTHEPIRTERRSAAGSQLITCLDVADISARFGADYVATVMRLLSLGLISDSESRDLLSAKRQQAASQWSTLVGDVDLGSDEPMERSFGLKAEILHLAVEAYRRELITKDRFVNIGERLQLPAFPTTKLLEFARAAR
jgi:transcriptional regulator with XRE-family HTH domain/Zn-dependent peptidase ImmA (M78 family)